MNESRIHQAARAIAGLTIEGFKGVSGLTAAQVRAVEAGTADHSVLKHYEKSLLEARGISVTSDRTSLAYEKGAALPELRGAVIAGARTAAGLTQKDLSHIARISTRTLASVEGGIEVTQVIYDALYAGLVRRGVVIEHRGNEIGFRLEPDAMPRESRFPDGSVDNFFSAATRKTMDQMVAGVEPMRLLRVEVAGSEPLVWRELAFPVEGTFGDLHRTIQAAFGWRDSHLHSFDCGFTIGDPEDGDVDEDEITLDQLASSTKTFTYLYDFGDSWTHRIIVGGKTYADGPRTPVVIDGERAGPMEDSGGIDGYNRLAADIRSGEVDKEKTRWLAHVGYKAFDPDAFDIEKVNLKVSEAWDNEPRSGNTEDVPTHTFVGAFDFGRDGYEREGHGDITSGTTLWNSKKAGRNIASRGTSSQVNRMLENASDVEGFKEFPKVIRYLDGEGDEQTLCIDYEVEYADGRSVYVHVVDDAPEARLAKSLFDEAGLDVTLVGSNMGYEQSEMVRDFRYFSGRKLSEESMEYAGRIAASRRPLSVTSAATHIMKNKLTYADGWMSSEPMTGALCVLKTMVAEGIVGIDYTKPDFASSRVGSTGLSTLTLSFGELVEAYGVEPEDLAVDIEDDPAFSPWA